jgi:TonB family protein
VEPCADRAIKFSFVDVHAMAPITKDTDSLTGTPESTGRSANIPTPSPEAALKHQPVALEIPVTVNGARTIEGGDKREPFSESTKTVLVFGSGAVIRLSSTVAPGQLLFLTNEQTKREVVCQVVKSKNYRSVSGYVELEFTETAVGFWGMRFPADRIGAGPQPATTGVRPAAGNGTAPPVRPAAPRVETPAGKQPSGNVAAKPPAAAPVTKNVEARRMDSPAAQGAGSMRTAKPSAPPTVAPTTLASEAPLVEPWRKKTGPTSQAPAAPPAAVPSTRSSVPKVDVSVTPEFELPHVADRPASLLTQKEPASAAPVFELESVLEEAPPARHQAPPQGHTVTDSETEELRQHTARLQEQLASMKFVETPASSPAKPMAEPKIPTWLAPLSGRTAAPSSTEELILREKARRRAEQATHQEMTKPAAPQMTAESVLPDELTEAPVMEEVAESVLSDELTEPPVMEEAVAESALPDELTEAPVMEEAAESVLSDELTEAPTADELTEPVALDAEEQVVEPLEEESVEEGESGKSKGLLVAVAAAGVLLVVGGGWWFMKQRSSSHASGPVATAPAVSAAPQNSENATKEVPGGTIVTERDNNAASPAQPVTPRERGLNRLAPTLSAAPPRRAQTNQNAPSSGDTTDVAAPGDTSADDAKKSLGSIRFEAPKVVKKGNEQSGAGTDAGVSVGETAAPATSPDPLGSGLSVANNQPPPPSLSAPASATVGGDVKQAKLVSSVPPAYPALAKSQHVSGNVTIDALIDATGRVTAMRVVSGPTLLQEAAKDALRLWKYQPATLDGKAVPMHLTVTVQFRLQQ